MALVLSVRSGYWRLPAYQLCKDGVMPLHPSLAVEAERTLARRFRPIGKACGDDEHRLGESLRRRRMIALAVERRVDADPGVVADELGRAAARRVDDRQSGRHRLEDDGRARIVVLRVQQDVRTSA